MSDNEKNIADWTEEELIHTVLMIYAGPSEESQCKEIARHIETKLTHRRKLIRERRKRAAMGKA